MTQPASRCGWLSAGSIEWSVEQFERFNELFRGTIDGLQLVLLTVWQALAMAGLTGLTRVKALALAFAVQIPWLLYTTLL